jgi:pyruvate dehydrogenase E1 component beta subunit|tara:strand:- start:1567 stop:2097 length:531 start_codon:yes stop_codon:yes gene_type:complete
MKYKDELIKSMKFLGKQDNTIFVGQQTEFKGNALYNTMVDVPQDKRLEFPVAEELQMGFCTGLSLEGYVPISFYPRMDFIILTFNQLINHLDKFENMTNGKYKPKQIIRTAIGSLEPLNGGVQHTQNYVETLKTMVTNVDVVVLEEPEQIFKDFKNAYYSDRTTILVEYGDYYNLK